MRNYQILEKMAADMYASCILRATDRQAQKLCSSQFADMMATIKALEYQKNTAKPQKARTRLMPFD
jgi:hypothetical protein